MPHRHRFQPEQQHPTEEIVNAPIPYQQSTPVVRFAEMQKMAQAIAQSGLFGMKEANQALALMLAAQAEGQHPATITQDYDIIQGKACRKTHSVLARFQRAGGTVEWHELTDKIADATFTHASGGSLRMEWTIAMAEQAKLTGKDNWTKYPRAMLRARCIAEGVRAVYPAAIGGSLLVEEALDLDAIPGEVVSRSVRAQPKVSKPRAKSLSAPKDEAQPKPEQPKPAEQPKAADGKLSEGQLRILKARFDSAQISDEQFKAKFGVSLADLPAAKFNDAAAWIREMAEAAAGAKA
jgi:hypothetical protein